MTSEAKPQNYIQDRLDALSEIDSRIVSLLESFSTVFESYSNKDKEGFASETKSIYQQLSKVAINLRKEVKHMDDNIGVYDKNKDGVMILPINVDQKNTLLGREKLNLEVVEMAQLLGKDSPFDSGLASAPVDEQKKDTSTQENSSSINIKEEFKDNDNSNDNNNEKEQEKDGPSADDRDQSMVDVANAADVAEVPDAAEVNRVNEVPGSTPGATPGSSRDQIMADVEVIEPQKEDTSRQPDGESSDKDEDFEMVE